MLFVLVLDPPQNLNGLLNRGLLHNDGLETTLQGRIALNVLAIIVQRRSADRLELTTGERRLKDVGRVDGALRCPRPHQHVQFVNEENAVACALNLLDHLLQPLFELAAVLGPCDERADVQCEQALPLQRFGHITARNPLRQPLDDGRLANARLPDQDRVVLGAPRQNLNKALDLLLSPHDRVELIRAGRGSQIDTELVHCGSARRLSGPTAGRCGLTALRSRLREDARGFAAHPFQVHAKALEHARRDTLALAHEAEQKVLGPDVVMVEPARLVDGKLDHLLGTGRQPDLAEDGAVTAPDDEFDGRANLAQLHPQVGEHLRGDAVPFPDQAQEQVLRADVVVVEPLRLLLSQCQDAASSLSELVESVGHSATPTWIERINRPTERPYTRLRPRYGLTPITARERRRKRLTHNARH